MKQRLQAIDAAILGGLESIPNILVIRDARALSNSLGLCGPYSTIESAAMRESLEKFIKNLDFNKLPKQPSTTVDRLQLPGGSAEFYWTAIPYRADERCLLAVIGLDRSAALQTEQKLFQLSKLATLGEMATSLAHEMTQPLNIIAIASANLKRLIDRPTNNQMSPDEINAEIIKKIERIQAAVKRSSGVISHMRVFGRNPAVNDPNARVSDVIDGLQCILNERLRIDETILIFECAPNMPDVAIPTNLLEQVLLNLINNASDSISERRREELNTYVGKITGRVAQFDDGSRPTVEFLVHDNGAGISADVRRRLFQPFFTTKPAGKGTGLGLSVSHGILHDYAGDLSYQETLEGAAFKVVVPTAASSATIAA